MGKASTLNLHCSPRGQFLSGTRPVYIAGPRMAGRKKKKVNPWNLKVINDTKKGGRELSVPPGLKLLGWLELRETWRF